MRTLVFVVFFAPLSAFAAPNFSGKWVGKCTSGDNVTQSTRTIVQTGEDAVTINDFTYNLGKPTFDDYTWEEANNEQFRELSVYNYRWSSNKSYIETSARWVGGYVNLPETWSGSSEGTMKLLEDTLVVERKLAQSDEICVYKLQSKK